MGIFKLTQATLFIGLAVLILGIIATFLLLFYLHQRDVALKFCEGYWSIDDSNYLIINEKAFQVIKLKSPIVNDSVPDFEILYLDTDSD